MEGASFRPQMAVLSLKELIISLKGLIKFLDLDKSLAHMRVYSRLQICNHEGTLFQCF